MELENNKFIFTVIKYLSLTFNSGPYVMRRMLCLKEEDMNIQDFLIIIIIIIKVRVNIIKVVIKVVVRKIIYCLWLIVDIYYLFKNKRWKMYGNMVHVEV